VVVYVLEMTTAGRFTSLSPNARAVENRPRHLATSGKPLGNGCAERLLRRSVLDGRPEFALGQPQRLLCHCLIALASLGEDFLAKKFGD